MPSIASPNGKANHSDQQLDADLPIPLYHQAYTIMRSWIASGDFVRGDQFPTEAALCEKLGVSRITIKRALSELAAEGLIARHRGRGTIVKAQKLGGIMRADFGEMMKNLHDVENTTDIELLTESEAVPPLEVADDLDLEPGVAALQILRRRLMDGEPYVYSVSYIPTNVAARFPSKGAEQTSLLQLLTDAGYPPFEAYQRMNAASAEESVAKSLELEPGQPVLKAVRVFKTAELLPVQHTTMYFRPDRYEYTLVLPASEAND